MNTAKTYDLFICHAWRFHPGWVKLVEALDAYENLTWRNFSVPWHDPAIKPNTPDGEKIVLKWLESQIKPVEALILLTDVYDIKSAQKWLNIELEIAKKHKIAQIAMKTEDCTKKVHEAFTLCDRTIEWGVDSLLQALNSPR